MRRWPLSVVVAGAALALTGCVSGSALTGVAAPSSEPSSTAGPLAVQGRAWVFASPGFAVEPGLADAVARQADQSARSVDELWGVDWPRAVVVVIEPLRSGPAPSPGETPTPGTVIAVTRPGRAPVESPPPGAGEGSYVVIDPTAWQRLPPTGRAVVLTHELTHVATDSVHTGVPRWLEEGFADYVAWTGTGIPVGVAAGDALEQVRLDGLPAGFPSDRALDPSGPVVAGAVDEAYLAVRTLAQTYGSETPAAVYRAAVAAADQGSSGSPTAARRAVDGALLATIGIGWSGLERAWRADLARLAAAP